MRKIYRFLVQLVLSSLLLICITPLIGHSLSDEATTINEIDLLSPVDTSSPRITLLGFLQEAKAAHRFVLSADQEARQTSGLSHSSEILKKGQEAEIRMERAMRYLDLSNVPEVKRDRKGLSTAILLKDILDRVTLPPFSEIPSSEEGEEINRWEAFPGIEIEKIAEGTRTGEYLFTKETVNRVAQIYRVLKKVEANPDQITDFYTLYIATPGNLLPPKWSYWLPAWSMTMLWEQTLWQWGVLLLTLVIALGLYLLVDRLQRLDRAESSSIRKNWEALLKPIVLLLLIGLVGNIRGAINITGAVDDTLSSTENILFFGALSWLIFMLLNAIGRSLISSSHFQDKHLKGVMVRNGFRILGVIAVVITLYTGAKRLGLDVAPLLAGIGAGSLALSFGIQPYVRNAIGGISLLVNRTMQIGEVCQIGGATGIIEDIGLTSTQLRKADRSLVTLPNASIVDKEIINYSRRDKFLFESEVMVKRLSIEDAIDIAMQKLQHLFDQTPLLADTKVSLVDLSADTLKFSLKADVLTTDQTEYEAIQRELLLKLQSFNPA